MAALDAQELLHLGLHASQCDDTGRAIDYLKQCLVLQPDNAGAAHLLGALYAQIGIYDRAKQMLSRAVELDGAQSVAIFQLGLLHLTSGEVQEASKVWERLDSLQADHFLNLFRRGLLALAADEFAECVALLERGIMSNGLNEALNEDMRRLRASAEAAALQQSQPSALPEPVPAGGTGQYLLGNYRNQGH